MTDSRYRGTCAVEECNGVKQFAGHCIPHARKLKIAPFDIDCRLAFCDRTREFLKSGLCLQHHNADRAGKELKPLRRKRGELRGPQEIDGYITIWKPDHSNARKNGRIFEHVFVMSEHLGRPLFPEENVHHLNGVRDDNRLENLELWSVSQPPGQRVEDKIKWAVELLERYGYESASVDKGTATDSWS